MNNITKTHKPTGLELKTRKREEENTTLRKQKRDKKLGQKRGYGAVSNSSGSLSESADIEALISRYQPYTMVKANDLSQLTLLNSILQAIYNNNKITEMTPYYHRLFDKGSLVMHYLLASSCVNIGSDQSNMAISCLVNLTASVRSECGDYIIAGLLSCNFTKIATQMLSLGPGCPLDTRHLIWKIVANVAYTSREARNDLFFSPLFQTNAFMIDLNNNVLRQIMIPVISEMLGGIDDTEYGMIRAHYPMLPRIFVFTVWPRVLDTLLLLDQQDTTDAQRNMVYCAIRIMRQVLVEYSNQREDLLQLFSKNADTIRILHRLPDYYAFSEKARYYIVKLMFEFSKDHNAVLINTCKMSNLLMFAHQSKYKEQRITAVKAINNIILDGIPSIKQLVDLHVIEQCFIPLLEKDHLEVQRHVCNAVSDLVGTCAATASRDSTHFLRYMLLTQKIFKHVIKFVTPSNPIETVKSVLQMMIDALTWDVQVAKEALENSSDMKFITILMQSQNAELYKMAAKIDGLWNNNMELEDDNDLVFPDLVPVGPNVFVGSFRQ